MQKSWQDSCQDFGLLNAVCENPGRNRVNSALIWPYENEKVVPKVVPIPARNLAATSFYYLRTYLRSLLSTNQSTKALSSYSYVNTT